MPRGRSHRRAAAYQVFISHATEDKWIAVQLDRMLRDAGLATFRDDRDIAGGAKIPQELRDQIKGSREVLLLWTPQAMNSEWVKLEIGMACAFNLRIVPVRYLTEAVSLPPYLREVHAPQLTEHDLDKYLHEVVKRASVRGPRP